MNQATGGRVTTAGAEASIPERDLKAQGAVLDLLLFEREGGATIGELEADLADEVSLADQGAIGWAVEDLVGVGLLALDDGRVRPTPAATHFHMIGSV